MKLLDKKKKGSNINMETPIYDFVTKYKSSGISRFHMPGHKGQDFIGCEALDITEIEGADVLSMANGIIAESQFNASRLFGAGKTLYSTEGSSLCIKAMFMAVLTDARKQKKYKNEYILAARNIHRSAIDACAILGIGMEFIIHNGLSNLYINNIQKHLCYTPSGIIRNTITPQDIEIFLKNRQENNEDYPIAVYITSPGYLGSISDIKGIAAICEKYFLPLIVDNAHGAYLAFLEENCHPLKLGAAICCDSAHKTLPVLTGGAYLHISEKYTEKYADIAAHALALFGSTSPSYLILQSLDLCNRYIADNYKDRLAECIKTINKTKKLLQSNGICVLETEPLKIVINTANAGYTGIETSIEMRKYGIECEYADTEFIVLMATPENSLEDFNKIKKWASGTFLVHNKKEKLVLSKIHFKKPVQKMTIRDAAFAPSEIIDTKDSLGRICASETISCPPAIPIAVCGEIIDKNMVELFKIYGIKKICVVL